MAQCAAYDVGDASHPAVPVDIAAYDPVILPQTGLIMPSYDFNVYMMIEIEMEDQEVFECQQ